MIDLLPNKDWFYPEELVRIFKGFKGFSKSSIYRKIEMREIEAEPISAHATRISRSALVAYFERVKRSRCN